MIVRVGFAIVEFMFSCVHDIVLISSFNEVFMFNLDFKVPPTYFFFAQHTPSHPRYCPRRVAVDILVAENSSFLDRLLYPAKLQGRLHH